MMHVSGITIAILGFCALVSVAMPVGLFLYCRKNLGGSMVPFAVGCGSFILFAMVLESLCHNLVFFTPVGETIFNNMWLYAVYGGLAAGVFEETGRFLSMKWLKKKHNEENTDLIYGAGHGGIEVLLVLGLTMVQYLIFSLMINTGRTEEILAPLDAVNRAAAEEVFSTLANQVPWSSLLAPVERVIAVVLHMSLSVLVWQSAVRPGKLWLYPVAILIHAAADASAVILTRLGLPAILVECWLVLIDIAVVLFARSVRRNGARQGE